MTQDDFDDDDFDDVEWFDDWCERASKLSDEEDYARLVECCRERFERNRDDLYGVEALAEAYVLNNQGQDAIDLLTPYYMNDPDEPTFEHAILDALLAIGKRVEDFPWKVPPGVIPLTQEFIDACYEYLKPKRRPRPAYELLYRNIGSAYLLFSEDDLVAALSADRRFLVTKDWGSADISVVRK
jgi:hypothetical protein